MEKEYIKPTAEIIVFDIKDQLTNLIDGEMIPGASGNDDWV